MTERLVDLMDRTFSATEREVVYRLIRSRRDVRQFAPDPIPPEMLLRILEAAHHAPSVGFMQPWNFVLITSPQLRTQIKVLFEEINEGEAHRVSDHARQQLLALLEILKHSFSLFGSGSAPETEPIGVFDTLCAAVLFLKEADR